MHACKSACIVSALHAYHASQINPNPMKKNIQRAAVSSDE